MRGNAVWGSFACAAAGFVLLGACSTGPSADTRLVLRGPDDIQVMSPEQVAVMKGKNSPSTSGGSSPDATATSDTVPLNQDNRPPEVKLFAAYQKFTSCLQADGYKVEGNLQDRSNPAFQNKEYVAALTKCAARSDILGALRATNEANAKLTPAEVQAKNENLKKIGDCLKKRNWTVKFTTSDIGLLQPTQFTSPEGGLNERDINQCVTETGLNMTAESGK